MRCRCICTRRPGRKPIARPRKGQRRPATRRTRKPAPRARQPLISRRPLQPRASRLRVQPAVPTAAARAAQRPVPALRLAVAPWAARQARPEPAERDRAAPPRSAREAAREVALAPQASPETSVLRERSAPQALRAPARRVLQAQPVVALQARRAWA